MQTNSFASEASIQGWIPRPVAPGIGLPLPPNQVIDLYATNRSVLPDIEQELSQELPKMPFFPSSHNAPGKTQKANRSRKSSGIASRSYGI